MVSIMAKNYNRQLSVDPDINLITVQVSDAKPLILRCPFQKTTILNNHIPQVCDTIR